MKLTMYELENNRQTQERGENHLYDSDCPDMLCRNKTPNCRRKRTLSTTRFSFAANPNSPAGNWNPCRNHSTPVMLRTNRWNRSCLKRKWRHATGHAAR
ncbi:hypothetical protein NXW05_10090 [Phocaeicola vulgatus]|nr:hypothetical protein [Phocaeicola vulgatus]